MRNPRRNRLESALAAAGLLALCASAYAGDIAGVLTPADRVSAVSAVDREAKKTFPAEYDRKTGAYRLRNLPPGTYDLVLETSAGRIEGVDLRPEPAAAARKPTVMTPGTLDGDEIPRIADILKKFYAERVDAKEIVTTAVLARFRQGKMASVAFVNRRVGAKPIEVPLKEDEPSQVGDLLLGLNMLAKVRDQLPADFDLLLELPEGKAGDVRIDPVAPELTDKDRAWIVDWVARIDTFENKVRVLDMDGDGQHARVLVEKVRDKQEGLTLPVSEPTAFWRVEIFEFTKLYGGWAKEKNVTVVFREQTPIRKFRAYRWMFEKRLGGIHVFANAATIARDYEVPEKLDPAKGRVPY